MKHVLIILLACSFSLAGMAQEKIEPRVDISYFKTADDVPYLRIRVRKRIERRYFPMEAVSVRAYFNEESDAMLMGAVTTNDKGEGRVEMPTELMDGWHHADSFDFYAVMDETDSTEAVSELITISRARIRMAITEDKEIIATVERAEGDEWVPVPEVETKFFVKRQFGRLPVTDDFLSTDEEGISSVVFEGEIPGDSAGTLLIGCWIEDHEEFGNLINYSTTTWGVPTVDDSRAFTRRTLWSTRDKTPYWLLIFPNLIILGVWGAIVYLVMQIVKIKRLYRSN